MKKEFRHTTTLKSNAAQYRRTQTDSYILAGQSSEFQKDVRTNAGQILVDTLA